MMDWQPGDPVHPAERPEGVPSGARYFPPADDFAGLKAFNDEKRRGNVRVAFPFAIFQVRGEMDDVMHRAISARPSKRGEYRCWCFTQDGPVPGVWAWTLADERADFASVGSDAR